MTSTVNSSVASPLFQQEQVSSHCQSFVTQLKQLLRPYGFFHISCFAAAAIELLAILCFSSSSFLLAISLAALCLTAFSYLILLFYFQAKKPEQLSALKERFLEQCRSVYPSSLAHMWKVPALYQLAASLNGQEYTYYPLPEAFAQFTSLSRRISAQMHWKDLLQMKEILLLEVAKIGLELIKAHPTAVHAHAELAQAYVALSKLYLDPRKNGELPEDVWVSSAYGRDELFHKFQFAAERALEELQIVNDLAPDESWIYLHRAAIYHDLALPEKEISSYEAFLQFHPEDRQALLHLGALYFQQGHHAKGLRIYQQLQQAQDPHIDDLIAHYNSFHALH